MKFRKLRKAYNSIAVLFESTKSTEAYLNLFLNGYIYLWSANLCFKKADRNK